MISLWEYWALITWEVDKGIFDELMHFVCRFHALKGPLKVPWGSPMVINGQTIVPSEVEIKYSTMGWFYYGNSEHYLWGRQRNIWRFEAFFCCFQAMKGPLTVCCRFTLVDITSASYILIDQHLKILININILIDQNLKDVDQSKSQDVDRSKSLRCWSINILILINHLKILIDQNLKDFWCWSKSWLINQNITSRCYVI